jgi:hypothetical protein
MSFRPYTIQVSGPVFAALRALAATQGLDCPDILADAMLEKQLGQEPEVEFRRKAFSVAMKDIDERAKALFQKQ